MTYKEDGGDTCESIDATEGDGGKGQFCVSASADGKSKIDCQDVDIV